MGETIMVLKARELDGKSTPTKLLGERNGGDSIVFEVRDENQSSNAFVGAGVIGGTIREKRFIGGRRKVLEEETVIGEKTGVL